MVEPTVQPQTDEQGNVLPPQGAAPGQAPGVTPGGIVSGVPSLVDAISAAYMRHLSANQPPPVSAVIQQAKAKADAAQPVQERPQPAPGSFGDKLSSAAEGVEGALGDVAHAHDTRGGWLSGMLNTMRARNARLEQKRKDDILLAKTQAETVALHRNIWQQDESVRQASYKANQTFVDQYKVNHDVEENVTHDQLMKRAQTEKDFLSKYYVRATSEEPMLDANGEPVKDKDGNPVTHPMYSIIARATKDGQPDDKTVSAEMSTDMQKYLGQSMPVNTRLTGLQYAALDGQIGNARNATNILQMTNGKDLSPEQMKVLNPYLTDPTIQAAISHVPGSAYAGLKEYETNADRHILDLQQKAEQAKQNKDQAAYDQIQSQISQIQEEKNKVSQFTSQAITPKQIEEYTKNQQQSLGGLSEFIKDPTKVQGHAESAMAMADDIIKRSNDPAEVAQAKRVRDMAQNVQKMERQNKIDTAVGEQTAKDAAAKIDNNPNGLTGEEFIKTLPVGRANMVRAIAQGRLPVNPAAFERSQAGKPNQLADDVFAAYPDFNATLGSQWPKSWDNFMVSGNDHKKVQAFNVALQHMKDLYTHTTGKAMVPGTDDYQKRQVDINYVGREVGNAVAQGVLTQKEADEVLNSLDSVTAVTPEMKRTRVKETAHLLDAKIQEVQREFDATSPSAGIKTPTLQSPAAKSSFDFVMRGGDQQQVPQQFQGKIGVTVGDKTHYFDTQQQADNFKKLAGIQ